MADTEPVTSKRTIISARDLAARQPESFPTIDGGPDRGQVTWHTLFSSPTTQTNSLTAGIAICPPEVGHLCPHRHTQAEIYYIIEGSGVVTIDGEESRVEKGASVFIPADAEHSIRDDGAEELRWLYRIATDSFHDVVYRFSADVEQGRHTQA